MPNIHSRFRVWLYDLKMMADVNDIDFENKVLHFTAILDPNVDHDASELMESTLLYVGGSGLPAEMWEGDVVFVPGLLSSGRYVVEWYFNRWILRHRTKQSIKEITQSGLSSYRVEGHIYK